MIFKDEKEVLVRKYEWNNQKDRLVCKNDYTAAFIKWGTDYKKIGSEIITFTVAIVRKENGEIRMPKANKICFVTRVG